MVYKFDGTKHGKLRDMQAARRAKYLDLVRGGTDFTQAAHAAGASECTGKVWRNGRTRSTGRNERPLADRYRGGMDKPRRIDAGHPCMDGRIAITGTRRAGSGVRAIARPLGRAARHHQPRAAPQRRRHRRRVRAAPRPAEGHPPPQTPQATQDHARHTTVGQGQGGPDMHWSPEQIAGRLRRGHPDNGSMDACHETIHLAIHVQGKGELRLQLKHAMRRGHVARRHRGDGQSRRPRFREPMAMTGDRPAEVADRYHEHQ